MSLLPKELEGIVQHLLDTGNYRTKRSLYNALHAGGKYTSGYVAFIQYLQKRKFRYPSGLQKRKPSRKKVRNANHARADLASQTHQEHLTQQCQALVKSLAEYALNRAAQESPALSAAVRVYLKKRKRRKSMSLEKLISLFTMHEEAKILSQPYTLQDYATRLGISITTASETLSMIHGPQRLHQKRIKVDDAHSAAIYRAIDLPLSYQDIGFFIGLPGYIVQQHMQKIGKEFSEKPYVKRFSTSTGTDVLTYHKLAEIYEASDLGYGLVDVCELLSISYAAYTFAYERRHIYEYQLIHSLRKIYNAPHHSKPYVTADLKRLLKSRI